MSGWILFGVCFALIVLAAIGLPAYDGVAVTVTEARAGTAMGMETAFALEAFINLALKAVIGGVFTGFAIVSLGGIRKALRKRRIQRRRGTWRPGPNANFRQVSSAPKLSRSDLLLLALVGKQPPEQKAPTLSPSDFPSNDLSELEF